MRQGTYGWDAPYVPLLMLAGAAVFLIIAVVGHSPFPLISTGFFLLMTASYAFTTRRGKFLVWTEVLEQLQLKGSEKLLDLGCGRGAVLLLAAKALPRGTAVGIDLWSASDQSGNAEAVTRRNAELEGVSERVELHTGDMRTLPFPDGTFDVVVSSLAVHNIPDAAGRAAAVREAVRVLRPGGRVALADFRNTADYARELQAAGLQQVSERNLGWRFWYGGPWTATKLVTGTKA